MAKQPVISLAELPSNWLKEARLLKQEALAERIREVVRKRVRARQEKKKPRAKRDK